MKFSILIPTFNSSRTIQDSINSILFQSFKNYEIIIIDNLSSDETIKVIRKNNLENIKYIIEKDNGIFDAINKGIKLSSGEIISLLHSDDVYYDSEVLQNVYDVFKANKISIVYGDLVYVKKNNLKSILRYWKSKSFTHGDFLKGWHPPHPSFFVKKILFQKYNLYENNIGNAADVELMYRFLEKNNINFFYLNKILVKMRYGGKSNKNIISIVNQNRKIIKFLGIENNYCKIFRFFAYKLLNRLSQFIFRPKI